MCHCEILPYTNCRPFSFALQYHMECTLRFVADNIVGRREGTLTDCIMSNRGQALRTLLILVETHTFPSPTGHRGFPHREEIVSLVVHGRQVENRRCLKSPSPFTLSSRYMGEKTTNSRSCAICEGACGGMRQVGHGQCPVSNPKPDDEPVCWRRHEPHSGHEEFPTIATE